MLVGLLFSAGLDVSGQDLDKKITLNLKNVSLDEAIKQIGKAGGIYFSYSPQAIPVSTIVSVKAKNKSIREILDDVLKKNGVVYSVVENQVILKAAKPYPQTGNNKPENPQASVKNHTISGTIKDKESGEVLIGAYAYAKGTALGTTTNAYGFYSLSIPDGNYSMVFSLIGYKPLMQDIELKENKVFSLDLEAVKTEIKTVEIVANEEEESLKSGQLGISKIQPKLLEQLPGIAGDIDIVKSLQAIPGIKSFGDGSAMFYTRGGKSDQNLILVDEAPIYNPAHLFGFVSALAPEAIKEMTVYKGDAPANFGGRLSSVIEIKTRDGNMKRFGFAGNFGPYVSDIALESPFKRDKASWLIAGRVSNLNWLFGGRLVNRNIKMQFFDINSKLNFTLNNNNRLFFTFYYGQDVFTRKSAAGRTFGITWNNLLAAVRWNHIFNNKLFSNTTVYYSRYNYFLYIYKEGDDFWKSGVSKFGVKSDFTWYLNPDNTLRMGFDLSPQKSDPGNVYFSDASIQSRVKRISRYNSAEYALYICNDQNIGKKFNMKYGVRLLLWQNYGPENVYVFDDEYQTSDTLYPLKNRAYASFVRPEPRLIMNYLSGKNNSIRFTYARTAQFVQLLNNSNSPFTSLESWVPAGPNIKPQTSDIYALGYFNRLRKSTLLFSTEAYYKQFHHTVDYNDHSNILYNPILESDLRFGRSWSYGLEIMFRKVSGKLTGWVAYSYSRAITKINGINQDKVFPASFDTPHELTLNLSFDTYKRWSFVLNWIYHTGSPVSTPTAFYYYNGVSVPYYGEKNNDRLPDYHRLDLSVIFNLSTPERKYQHSLSLNIFNLYARKNPFSLNFNKFKDNSGNYLVTSDADGTYEKVPTVISASGIIPSLNYKFRF